MCSAAVCQESHVSDMQSKSHELSDVLENLMFQICRESLCFRTVKNFMFQTCWRSQVSTHRQQ
jgi:hypothetical protein